MESIVKLRRHVYDTLTKSAAYAINDMIDEVERDVAELTDERDLLKTQWEAGVDFDQRLEACADNREDVTLFGVDYTPLPVDADGVPIHVGDVVTAKLLFGGTSEPLVVDRMELSRGKDGYLWTIALDTDKSCFNLPDILRHHHAPTVEDVLREFAYGLGVPVADSYVAATAAKLRLAEGSE